MSQHDTPPTTPHIIATFHPQAWIHDQAVTVDAEGPTTFDVTAEVLAMGKDAAEAIRDDDYPSDHLRYAVAAPQWIQDWSGPFWIEVQDAISEYFEEHAG